MNPEFNTCILFYSQIKEKYWNFRLSNFGMYQTCSFRATSSRKFIYLILHYVISGFGWTPQVLFPIGKQRHLLADSNTYKCKYV